jgi:hypothetical protein
LFCADLSCRLPHLSNISIKLDDDSQEGDLDPVLAVMLLHGKSLCNLSLHMGTSLLDHDVTWNYLGQMVSLTQLQLTFDHCVSAKLSFSAQLGSCQVVILPTIRQVVILPTVWALLVLVCPACTLFVETSTQL